MKRHILNFIRNFKFEYKITLIYLVFGFLWIFFSDKVLDFFVDDKSLTEYQTIKGTFYILVTSFLLFVLVKEHMQKMKKAEKKLYESEFRFNKLYENGPFGMVVANNKFRFEKVNPAFCEIIGYSESELLRLTFKDITHPDDLSKDLHNLQELIHKKINVYKTDKRYIKKNGKEIWCSLTVTATYNADGEFIYNLGIIEDISPRKQAEYEINKAKEIAETTAEQLKTTQQILLRSENLLSDIQTISKTGGFDYYLETNELYWTQGLYQLHETEPNPNINLIEMSVNCYVPHDKEKILTAFNKCITDGVEYDMEFPFVTLKGNKRWIRTKTQPIFENGKVSRVIGTMIDITEHKIIENQLLEAKQKAEESETRLELAVDSDKLGVWDLNLYNNELIWNDRMFHIYGIEKKTFEKNNLVWEKSLHPDDKEKALKTFNNAIQSHKEYNTQFRIVRPDKTILHIKSDAVIIYDAQNNPIRMIGINRDITEYVYNREKLMQYNEKLEQMVEARTQELTNANLMLNELNATKDKFFSIIAHDLKNPFNSLIGYSDLLLLNADKITFEKVKRYAELMNGSAKDAYVLLENLLEWSRIQTGKIEPNPVKTKPSEIIGEIKFLYEPMALAKGINVETTLKTDEVIFADKEMIKTVLRNLITNAVKFTYAKGWVKIETQKSKKNIEFTITDNGCGIETEHLQKLFKIDNKLSKNGTADEKGTGLGLILCKEFVEMNGGQISVESEVEKGSRFKFTIPFIGE